MTVYVALLRAINVGGTGKLAMSELRSLCEEAGFRQVRTYIQSGNLVFASALPPQKVQASLEQRLAKKMGKPVGVHVRSASELAAVLERNPFDGAQPSQVLVMFLDKEPDPAAIESVVLAGREQVTVQGREVYVHYPDGMGRSKLKLGFARNGTGRNLNTVGKLVEMAAELA